MKRGPVEISVMRWHATDREPVMRLSWECFIAMFVWFVRTVRLVRRGGIGTVTMLSPSIVRWASEWVIVIKRYTLKLSMSSDSHVSIVGSMLS